MGEIQLSRNLLLFATNIADLEDFFGNSLDIIHNRSEELFESQGKGVEKNDAGDWKELAPRTKKARKRGWGYYGRVKPGAKTGILQWSGALRKNVEKESGKDYGVFYFDTPYAIYHQKGGRNLPTRVLIDLDNDTNTKLVKAMQEKINNELGIFGLQA